MKSKTKKLFNLSMALGVLLILSALWLIFELFTDEFNGWAIVLFGIVFFITGYVGVEYANLVKIDCNDAFENHKA